jgi:glycosyltransferase involved in cell wall biosynthesis
MLRDLTMTAQKRLAAVRRQVAFRIPIVKRLVRERDTLRAEMRSIVAERDSLRADVERAFARRKTLFSWQFERRNGVRFIGYAEGALGLGEVFRASLAAAATTPTPFAIYPLRASIETRLLAPYMPEHYDHLHAYDVNIIAVAGDQLPIVYRAIHPSLFENSYNIFMTYWELPGAPEEWRQNLTYIDEIWVPNDFVANSFAQIFSGPIAVIPPAIRQPGTSFTTRASYGMQESRFYFMFSFDYYSSPFRKNPLAVLEAFRTAFPGGQENVGLVIKSIGPSEQYPEIQAAIRDIAKDPRIILIDKNLDRDDMLGLIRAADAYISLHRAEGFGLGMAEALSLGRIVIGTNYSGNTDFLNEHTGYPVPYQLRPVQGHEYPYSRGQVWAEPDKAAAVEIMRNIVANPLEAVARAAAGRTLVCQRYGLAAVGRLMQARLINLLEKHRNEIYQNHVIRRD